MENEIIQGALSILQEFPEGARVYYADRLALIFRKNTAREQGKD